MKGLLSEHLLIKHPKNTQRINREFLYSPTDRQDLPSYYRLLPKQRPDVLSYNAILQELLQKDDGQLWEIAKVNQLLAFTIRQQLIKYKKTKSSIQTIDAKLKILRIPIVQQSD